MKELNPMAKVSFTAARLANFKCPPDRKQAFLWDATVPGLGLRATPNGKPAFVFQGTLDAKDFRITIGSPQAWSIEQARTKAREFLRLIDQNIDPRAEMRSQAALRAKVAAESVLVSEAWSDYLKDRKPHWGARHYADHEAMVRGGGKSTDRGTRGRGATIDGPLVEFMSLRLRDLTREHVETWAAKEASTRPTVARLAMRHLRAFLNWCAESQKYQHTLSNQNVAKSRRAREALGKSKVKTDALLKEQLPAWFEAVNKLEIAEVRAYLQVLLLTGARPNEVLHLRWSDLDWKWRGIVIRDKVEGERVIPLTPHVSKLLSRLPRDKEYVFSGNSEGKPMSRPHRFLLTVNNAAGVNGLTLHGLRRSFGTLSEWLDVPAGVVAQIQGHKPSATAEKHYRVRPLDLLRVHHERIESWILEQARASEF